MSKNGMKSYFRHTLSFTLVFALVCVGIIGSVWSMNVYQVRTENADGTGNVDTPYINALLLGVDAEGYRTDVIILAQLNLVENTLNMMQIPRDTYIETNRLDHKINSCYISFKNGELVPEIQNVYDAVEYLLDVEVNDYIMVNFQGFRDIIDAIGGIEFNVPRRMKYDDPTPGQDLHIDLQPGMQHLDGAKAEQLVRFRQNNDGTGYAMGDLERNQVQKDFIMTVIDKVFSLKGVTKIPEMISIVSKSVKTSFSNQQMLQYAPFIMGIEKENINIMGLEGVAEMRNGLSYFVPNDALNEELIETYFTVDSSGADTKEIARRDKLMNDDSGEVTKTDAGRSDTANFLRLFTEVEIVDGSNGAADIDAIVQELSDAGYKTVNTIDTGTITYPSSRIITAEDDGHANTIGKLLGLESYLVDAHRVSGGKVILVVGKDWEKQ